MNRWTPLILIAIAGLTLVLPALKSSYVYNENGRLASGQLYLETGDYSSFRVNPPLVSLIGAIPATLGGAERPTRAELGIASFARDEYRAGTLFVEKNLRESRERLNTTELVLALFEAVLIITM